MSYNIDSFKVKKLDNFKISVRNFDKKVFGNKKFKIMYDIKNDETLR